MLWLKNVAEVVHLISYLTIVSSECLCIIIDNAALFLSGFNPLVFFVSCLRNLFFLTFNLMKTTVYIALLSAHFQNQRVFIYPQGEIRIHYIRIHFYVAVSESENKEL